MERQDGGALSTPLGSSKLLGQLELKLRPSKTGLSFSVLPGFCLEQKIDMCLKFADLHRHKQLSFISCFVAVFI